MTTPLAKGKTAYIQFWDTRKQVTILDVFKDTVAVTAPGGPLPAKNVGIILEIPTLEGMFCYHTHVAAAPVPGDEALLLRRCASVRRFDRRRTWRVPVRARTKVSRAGEPRAFPAVIADVSAEGAQLHTDGHFDLGEVITFRLHLPDELPHHVSAKVVRSKEVGREKRSGYTLGVLFQELPGPARKALTFYIWKRLQELFPREVRKLFRRNRERSRELDRRLGLIGAPGEECPLEAGAPTGASETPKDVP